MVNSLNTVRVVELEPDIIQVHHGFDTFNRYSERFPSGNGISAELAAVSGAAAGPA